MSRRNLANLDRDIAQMPNRLIQEAMAHGIENDMIYGGLVTGQTAMQAILADPVATQNCVIGTRRVSWDGKVYKYSHAGGVCSTELLSYSDHRLQALNWAAVVSGGITDQTVVVTVGAADGDGAGAIAANYLVGGEILFTNFAGLTRSFTARITSNTAVAAGGAMTVGIDKPLPVTLTALNIVEAMGCPYRQLHGVVNCPADASFVGRATSSATAALPYHWQQTWGLCFLTPNNGNNTVDVGNTAYNSQITAWNGTIGVHDDANARSEYQQHIGFTLSRAQGGTTQGAPIIMLQIAP